MPIPLGQVVVKWKGINSPTDRVETCRAGCQHSGGEAVVSIEHDGKTLDNGTGTYPYTCPDGGYVTLIPALIDIPKSATIPFPAEGETCDAHPFVLKAGGATQQLLVPDPGGSIWVQFPGLQVYCFASIILAWKSAPKTYDIIYRVWCKGVSGVMPNSFAITPEYRIGNQWYNTLGAAWGDGITLADGSQSCGRFAFGQLQGHKDVDAVKLRIEMSYAGSVVNAYFSNEVSV